MISVKHVFFQFDGDACYFSLKYTTSLWKLTFTADFRAPLKAITVKCCCVGTEKGREDLLKVNKAHDEMYCRWRGKVGWKGTNKSLPLRLNEKNNCFFYCCWQKFDALFPLRPFQTFVKMLEIKLWKLKWCVWVCCFVSWFVCECGVFINRFFCFTQCLLFVLHFHSFVFFSWARGHSFFLFSKGGCVPNTSQPVSD